MSSIPTPSSLRTPRASSAATPRRSIGIPTPSGARPASRSNNVTDEQDREFEELMRSHKAGGLPPRTPSALARSTLGRSTARPSAVVNGGADRTPALQRSVMPGRAAAAKETMVPVPGAAAAVGDRVAGAGMQGALRFLGPIEGKAGSWAGIDLAGTEWEGRGKNDGTVAGKPYFECPALCGIFVPAGKITLLAPSTASPTPSPSPSPTASRLAPTSPSIRPSPLLSRSTTASSRPPTSLSASVMAGRTLPRSSTEARQLATSKITEGTRASKYLGMTAAHLASRPRPASPTKQAGDRELTRSPTRGGLPVPKTPTTAARTGVRPRQSLGPPLTGGVGGRRSIGPGSGAMLPPPLPPQTPTASGRRSTMGPSMIASTRRSTATGLSTPEVPPVPTEYRSASSLSTSVPPGIASRPESRLDKTPRRPRVSMGPAEIARPSSALSVSTSGRNSVLSVDRFLSDEKAERERELREAKTKAEELERRMRQAESESKRLGDEREEARRKAVELEDRADSLEAEVRRLGADADRRAEASERRRTSTLSELEVVHAAKLAELESQLGAKASEAQAAHAAEKADLAGQLDELRQAGQSLCEVYEEKIANQAQARIVAEDELHRLKGELAAAKEREGIRAGSAREGGREEAAEGAKLSEADLIDNEVLKADLKHARDRMSELQELLDGAREALANETASSVTKAQERGETQQRLKEEVRRLKDEVATREREKVDIKRRVGDVEAELKQAKRSQENERSELEQLRSDAVVVQEVAVLRSRLDEALEELAFAKIEVEEGKEREKGLREEVELMGDIKAEEGEQEKEEVRRLKKDLEARDEQLRRLKRGSQAQTAPTNTDTGSQGATTPNKSLSPGGGSKDTAALSSSMGSRRTSGAGSSLADVEALAAMKEQIVGLKSIIARMTEERADMQQGQRRVQAEADELRERFDSKGVDVAAAAAPSLSTTRLEGEVDTLKARISDMERRHGREVKALNKEVSELESLVEAKIFREDELESEIARCKTLMKAAESKRHRKTSSTASNGAVNGRSRDERRSASPRKSSGTLAGLGLDEDTLLSPSTTSSFPSSRAVDEDACELCGQGHQLDQCPIFLGTASLDSLSAAPAFRCSNCESDVHTTDDCPHGDEVF